MRLLFGLLLAAALVAQEPRGTIIGQVTDASNAAVPGAGVRATNIDTGVAVRAATNSQGIYEIPFLIPGPYRVEAEHAGFKSWAQPRVDLRMEDSLRIDIRLELGNVAEVINVTAEAPLVDSTSAGVGQVMGGDEIAEMPLRSGSLAWAYTMAPGVVMNDRPFDGPWNIDQSSNISMAGSRGYGADFNVDGVSNNAYGGRTAFVPPPDMVQELRVNVTNYDASLGRATGGSVNVSLKSGTNRLQGSVNVSGSGGPLMTRNFFTNNFIFDPTTGPINSEKIAANTPSVRWMRYSAAVGGPLVFPRLYDGRNRTFWMFGYQTHSRVRPQATQYTVPTEAQRGGDFGPLLAIGTQYQIYDPATAAPEGSTRVRRQPFAGNLIPTSRVHPVSRNVLKHYPLPNIPGTIDGLNNFSYTYVSEQTLHQPVIRVDHNISERHRMFARYAQSEFHGMFDRMLPKSDARGRLRARPYRGVALDDVIVLNNQAVLDVRYGFTWFQEFENFTNSGWDLAEFGFPRSLLDAVDPNGVSFPQIEIADLVQIGNNGGFYQTNYSHSLLGTVNWMRGSHSVKFGADARALFANEKNYQNASPQLAFAEAYTRGPLDNAAAAPTGQGLASFLLGIPSGGYVDVNDSRAQASRFLAVFVQDDWRASSALTLNLGLRWEYESVVTERFNRTTRDFDFQAANPIQAAAQAQYARSPIPEIPAADFRTPGGVRFAGLDGRPRGLREPFFGSVTPRVGVAWRARPWLVARAGYGIYFDLLGVDFTDAAQSGFNQRTNAVISQDTGLTFAGTISNPFPFGIVQPKGASGGLLTYLGRAPGVLFDRRPPPLRPALELLAADAARARLHARTRLPGVAGRAPARHARPERRSAPVLQHVARARSARRQLLHRHDSEPFPGHRGFRRLGPLHGAQHQPRAIAAPLPAFPGALHRAAGRRLLVPRLHRALPAPLQRRPAYAGQLHLVEIHAGHQLPQRHRRHSRACRRRLRPSPPVVAHRDLRASDRREEAVSLRRRGVVNHLIGGWQAVAIFNAQSGPALGFGNAIYNGAYTDIRLPNSERSIDRWFNTAGFVTATGQQLANNIRTAPSRITAVRADGINVWDLSLQKTFPLRERVKLQFRAQAEGAMNHPNFATPNTTPTSTLFGMVSGTQGAGQEERRIFLGLKLTF